MSKGYKEAVYRSFKELFWVRSSKLLWLFVSSENFPYFPVSSTIHLNIYIRITYPGLLGELEWEGVQNFTSPGFCREEKQSLELKSIHLMWSHQHSRGNCTTQIGEDKWRGCIGSSQGVILLGTGSCPSQPLSL